MSVDLPFLELLADKDFRHKWLTRDVSESISSQIRAMRYSRGWSQQELAERLGTRQSVIVRYERPDYDGYSIDTLLKIANIFDVALIVRFVSWPEFLRFALVIAPPPYGIQVIEGPPD